MRKILSGIAAIALAILPVSCGPQNSRTGSDGYTFGTKQYTQKKFTVVITEYPNRKEFLEAARAAGIKTPDVIAFSKLVPPKFDTCKVHIVDPKVSYQPEFLGHEFAHCIYGQWHTNNDSFK